MSLVFITHHDENIYNIVQTESAEQKKPEFYISKARKAVKPAKPDVERVEPNTFILTSSRKHLHKTMGYAETPLHAPDDFLRKDGGVKWRRLTDHKCFHKELPPVPEFDFCAKPPEREEQNFKKKNIKNVACSSPRRPKPRYAFTRTGDIRQLCGSGFMPAYVFRPNYGKVPKYIIATKKAEATMAQAKTEQEKDEKFKLITPEERLKLLTGLKANWQELQKTFQLQPVLTDTAPKKKRKAELEKELRQLEKDILLVESNPLIYVCQDDVDAEDETKMVYRKGSSTKDRPIKACLQR